ncbi:hypothetical protein KKG56_11775, partial [bacterium]|nr:hypothetical protein [bacterium]
NKIFTTLPLPAEDNLILKYLPIIYYLPISFISLSPFYYLNSYARRKEKDSEAKQLPNHKNAPDKEQVIFVVHRESARNSQIPH